VLQLIHALASGNAAPGGGANINVGAASYGNAASGGGGATVDVGAPASGNAASNGGAAVAEIRTCVWTGCPWWWC